MPEYLSKEEIKQWRSSLEKITLEEYAARLGKTIEEEKHTNDIIDIVLKGQPVMTRFEASVSAKGEKITSIAQKAFDREKEIFQSSLSLNKIESKPKVKAEKPAVKAPKVEPPVLKPVVGDSLREEVRIVFSKALTDREQLVFEHFLKHKNQVVYAKELAGILDLPRDYVYKYIKNLRAKIEGDKLQNSDNGGYVLNV